MRRKKKSGAGKMIAAVVVVVILLCGIFAIMKNLASPASADNKAGNKEGNSAKATEASTEAPDNSVPMTGLKVTAPPHQNHTLHWHVQKYVQIPF